MTHTLKKNKKNRNHWHLRYAAHSRQGSKPEWKHSHVAAWTGTLSLENSCNSSVKLQAAAFCTKWQSSTHPLLIHVNTKRNSTVTTIIVGGRNFKLQTLWTTIAPVSHWLSCDSVIFLGGRLVPGIYQALSRLKQNSYFQNCNNFLHFPVFLGPFNCLCININITTHPHLLLFTASRQTERRLLLFLFFFKTNLGVKKYFLVP